MLSQYISMKIRMHLILEDSNLTRCQHLKMKFPGTLTLKP